ncbi:MAG: hypothetical protein FJZ16_10280 [Candidatus Omnitrophica bacterium]|nr:hypothetical protein [Candidatus Omnitrophota bacterium]
MKSFIEEKYKLKADPFDSRVDLTAPMAGRKKEQKAWQKIVKERAGQRGNSFNFIIGDYGFGKSFSLYKIFEEVKEKHNNVLPIFMKLLPEDTVRKFGLDFVQRIFAKLELNDIKTILKQISKNEVDHLKNVLHDPGLVFEKVKKGDQLAFSFLRADRTLDKKELKELGVIRKIDSTDRAEEYLLAFLYILKKTKVDTLLLAIDEVEYIFSQMRGAKISLVFNTLRGIYDLQQAHSKAFDLGETANMIFFFGISVDGWRRLSELHKRERTQGGPIQPFMDRKDNIIALEPLNKDETKELIELRLSIDRVKGFIARKPLIPFTEKFVDYVFELTKGRPRYIIERCDRVLLDGLEQKIPLITVDFAKKVYESHALPT